MSFIKKIIYCCFCIVLLSSCEKQKYTASDGEIVFSSSFEVIPDRRLAVLQIEPLPTINDVCMEVTDFDYKNAGISMESYPQIEVEQYKKYFSRKGKFDFYLHPIICNGMVFDIKPDAEIVAYRLENGKVKKIWRKKTLISSTEKKNILLSQARLEDKKIYIATSNGWVLAFDTEEKNVVWKKKIMATFTASPTIYEDNLYLISSDDEVYAINKITGKLLWKTDNETKNNKKSFQIPPVAVYHGKIVAGFSNGWVGVFDTQGNLVWKNRVVSARGDKDDISDIDFPPLVYNNILVAGGINTSVMGFDFKTGQPLWQIPTGLNSYIFVNRQGAGFFINDKNENVCFFVQNGSVKWLKPNVSAVHRKVSGYLNNGKTVRYQVINRFFDAY